MSGVRVYNKELLEIGLTLPGFVERSKVIASLPSLGLLTLAAHTPENWEVLYKEFDSFTEYDFTGILDEKPDIVAFSSLTARINETYLIAQKLRSHAITVVIGGLHVSAMPLEAMQFADSVIQGEGEIIWEVLINDYENGTLKPFYSSLSNPAFGYNLDSDRIPRYNLLDISKYNRLTIQTTRGCPLHCNFCGASRMISKYKKKPIKQVEKELDKIFEIWDKPFIELADDNTFVDKKWTYDLLTLFSKYKMKWFTESDISVAYDEKILERLARSNCSQVLIGFEATSADRLKGIDQSNWKQKQFDNYLKAIDKIQSYGISVNGCFILGFDTDNENTFIETEQFIRYSNLSEVQITVLTPFPGTDLYYNLKKENRLLEDNFWNKCTLFDVTYKPKNFTVEEFEIRFKELMKDIYSKELVKQRKVKFKNVIRRKLNHEIN